MRRLVIGAHLLREDIEPLAEAIPVGDVFLSGVAIPDEQSVGDRDLLIRIAKIRAELLARAAFVAIRYGFIVTSAEDALSKVTPMLPGWKGVLELRRTQVEMTLKVPAESPVERPEREQFRTGGEYIRALYAARRAVTAPPEFRAAVERLLAPLTVHSGWRVRDEMSLEWNALLERDRVADAYAAAETLRSECSDTPFLFSGPWPLETHVP